MNGEEIDKTEQKIKSMMIESAEKEIEKATEIAKNIIEAAKIQAAQLLNETNEKARYIDISRVPLICQSIIGIDEKLKNITENMVNQDQFVPVKTLVYGFVTVILLGVVGALVALVIK